MSAEDAAVMLVEGMMIITGDLRVPEMLRRSYRAGLDPKGCAIVEGAHGPFVELNAPTPEVWRAAQQNH